jgi:hypothetical protein
MWNRSLLWKNFINCLVTLTNLSDFFPEENLEGEPMDTSLHFVGTQCTMSALIMLPDLEGTLSETCKRGSQPGGSTRGLLHEAQSIQPVELAHQVINLSGL